MSLPCPPRVPPEGAPASDLARAPGRRLARGICRLMRSLDFAALEEVVPTRGLRVDVMALGPRGEVWVIECKSSRQDFTADRKWRGYLPWCDRFFWAVPVDFPVKDALPDIGGLILADDYGAEIARMPHETTLPAPRRRALTLRFARLAALRHLATQDPMR